MFHLFNASGVKPQRLFSMSDYDETIEWATKQVKGIEEATIIDWLMCKENPDFYCTELCSARKSGCPNGAVQLGSKRRRDDDYDGFREE